MSVSTEPCVGEETWKILEDEVEYEVEAIVDERQCEDGSMEYFVKWVNYDSDENTWERGSAFERGGKRILAKWIRNQKLKRGRRQTGRRTRSTRSQLSEQERGDIEIVTVEDEDEERMVEDDGHEEEEPMEGTSVQELERQSEETQRKLFETLRVTEAKLVKAGEREVKMKREMEALTEENQRLKDEMTKMNLFKLCQKDPEKNLRQELQTLKDQHDETKANYESLQNRVRDGLTTVAGLEEKVEQQEYVLDMVADFLTMLLEERVKRQDDICDKIIRAEKVFTEMKSASRKLNETLEMVADFLGGVLNEVVPKSQIQDKLSQAKKVLEGMKEKSKIIDNIRAMGNSSQGQ